MKEQHGDKKTGAKLFSGAVSGFLNGLFGSGGGVVAVMFLRRLIGDERRAHASATLMVLLMSGVSLALYAGGGSVDFAAGWMFSPGGFAGAVLGSLFLKKIKSDFLRRLFGGVIAASGVVMLLR
ncbi:MAG: sulfite exporter TauE/SafE family protein [Oscillospiraceae bacterium]|nr:sulfite exporter TauE/SafE family protein [Oscillospiraceae bacterium]